MRSNGRRQAHLGTPRLRRGAPLACLLQPLGQRLVWCAMRCTVRCADVRSCGAAAQHMLQGAMRCCRAVLQDGVAGQCCRAV